MHLTAKNPGRPDRVAGELAEAAALGVQAGLAAAVGYLVALSVVARGPRDQDTTAPINRELPRLVVLIPAHDEEAEIEATLRALARCGYAGPSPRSIVIADNCTDRTAAVAAAAGAEVWERQDDRRRGKGHALGWALELLAEDPTGFDAVVLLDADCRPSENFLEIIGRRLVGGARALQVDYVVANAGASDTAALRYAGFALANTVRPLGKQRLGLSCGLTGTGMAFSSGVIESTGWSATGLAEDGEFHLRLVLDGERVDFASDASVRSDMPVTAHGATSQQERWEQGRLHLARDWAPRLIAEGIRRRDPVRLHAGLECLLPPHSLIAAGSFGSLGVAVAARSPRLASLALLTLGGQAAVVLGGLRIAEAPPEVYRALPRAPLLVGWKLLLYGRLLSGRGPLDWVRTERASSTTTSA